MTQLLLRLFVLDSDHTESPAVRTAYGKLSGWVGIFCNVLLCIAKLFIGTVSGSVSITADAVNNLSDASGSVVTLLGFKLASKPADEEHPYGHDRIEYLAGLTVAVLILVIGVELVKSSVDKILHPAPVDFSPAVAIVLICSILVKLWMSLFNHNLGSRIRSATLEATAADSRNDVISTAAVLAACIFSHLTHLQIDGYVGVLVALFILYSGIGIVKDTVDPLLGKAPDAELVHSIAEEVTRQPEVLGIHDLIVHDYGPGRRFASLHAEMDCRLDVLLGHEIIDNLEREVMEKLNVELVIHYDPIATDDEELNRIKSKVHDIIQSIDQRLAIHDFRMVSGVGRTNLIFDLVVPLELQNKSAELKREINEKIQFGDKKYCAVITIDCEAFNSPQARG